MTRSFAERMAAGEIEYGEGIKRTNVPCTDCRKNFVAKINYDLNGNHVIKCPLCGHLHYRTIKNGVVTGDRWDSQAGPNVDVPIDSAWSDTTLPIETNSAAKYIRKKWLDRD